MTAQPVRADGDLSPIQRRFVEEYLIDLNGYQAACRAGYSPVSARSHVTYLLANPRIWSAIEHGMAERGARTQVTADRVLRELGKIAFSDIRNVAEWTADGVRFHPSAELDDATAAAIAEVSEKRTTKPGKRDIDTVVDTNLKVKMHDKLKALEMCARHLGMFKEDTSDEAKKRRDLSNMSDAQLLTLVKTKMPLEET